MERLYERMFVSLTLGTFRDDCLLDAYGFSCTKRYMEIARVHLTRGLISDLAATG